ncbi:MAG: hypothetical protein HIU93_15810 [Acidobacteria bacterium]|nr:hypothetical protein [Acidobacteriota bacterium]
MGSGTGNAGGTTQINLSLTSVSGAAPSALQFKLGYAATSVANVSLAPGAAAGSAGKTLDCVTESAGLISCLLYGINSNVLSNGVVATVGVQLALSPGSTVPLQLSEIAATDDSGEAISSTGSSGSIAVNSVTPTLSSVLCTPSALISAGNVRCGVTLSGVTSSPMTVTLKSNDSLVQVPQSITVAANASGAQFVAAARPFTQVASAVLTASANGVTKSTRLQLLVVVTESVSGNLGVTSGGSRATVTLGTSSGKVLQTVGSQQNGNYAFTGVAPGTAVVTPTEAGVTFSPLSRVVTVGNANLAGTNFVSQVNGSTGTITVDAKVSADQEAARNVVVVRSLSTHATDELLLALISTDQTSSSRVVVDEVTGAGLTWTRVARANRQSGTSEIWRAFAPKKLTNVQVIAKLSQSAVSSLSVVTFTGVQTAGTGGSGAIGAVGVGYDSSGNPSASLKTTKNGSLVIGVGNDYDNAILRTPLPGQVMVHQDLSSTGDTYWTQILASTVPLAGTIIRLGDSAPNSDQYNMAICEVLPAGVN